MKLMTMKGFVIGLVLVTHICIGLLAYDYFTDVEVNELGSNMLAIDRDLNWAILVSPILFSLYVYVAGSIVIHDHAVTYKRSATRWIIACLVFTPILTGIAYLLTGLKVKTTDN